MTTGKTIALTRRTFVDKVMSLLFNMLSRLVITFLPRSKHLLMSWLQSPAAVILAPRKIKSATISTVSPSICHGKSKALTEQKEMASKSVNLELLTIGWRTLTYLQSRKLLYQVKQLPWVLPSTCAFTMPASVPSASVFAAADAGLIPSWGLLRWR